MGPVWPSLQKGNLSLWWFVLYWFCSSFKVSPGICRSWSRQAVYPVPIWFPTLQSPHLELSYDPASPSHSQYIYRYHQGVSHYVLQRMPSLTQTPTLSDTAGLSPLNNAGILLDFLFPHICLNMAPDFPWLQVVEQGSTHLPFIFIYLYDSLVTCYFYSSAPSFIPPRYCPRPPPPHTRYAVLFGCNTAFFYASVWCYQIGRLHMIYPKLQPYQTPSSECILFLWTHFHMTFLTYH